MAHYDDNLFHFIVSYYFTNVSRQGDRELLINWKVKYYFHQKRLLQSMINHFVMCPNFFNLFMSCVKQWMCLCEICSLLWVSQQIAYNSSSGKQRRKKKVAIQNWRYLQFMIYCQPCSLCNFFLVNSLCTVDTVSNFRLLLRTLRSLPYKWKDYSLTNKI